MTAFARPLPIRTMIAAGCSAASLNAAILTGQLAPETGAWVLLWAIASAMVCVVALVRVVLWSVVM